MKIALVPGENGRLQPITATASAPPAATCPACGGAVVLRRRKVMNSSDLIYYWRHQMNQNRTCSARSRPVA
ncbi:MAG: hypothetical protein GY803_04875 [Chloroflexi bacterium]|nr:hypothetical protein [Chloroflexota bacterium]